MSSKYQAPLIIESSEEHRQTFIVLHGRGSTAQKFAEPLLCHPVSPQNEAAEGHLFREHFPNAKFVFPTASLRRAAIWRRSLTHQWFDNWSLDRPEYREDLQLEGLKESSAYVHQLLCQEIEIIGAQNVFLIGLSQGCALSLTLLITWNGPAFAGVLGMCGWMPFRKRIEEVIQEQATDPDDPFESSESDFDSNGPSSLKTGTSKVTKARQWLGEELDLALEEQQAGALHIPIFLGHGILDEKVPCCLGKEAALLFSKFEFDVKWETYENLGHWYSADMLRDMVLFIKSHST